MPSKIIVNNIEVNEDKRIANEFNNFFIDIGPELAKQIPRPARSFESYVPKSNSTMSTGPISVNELKNAFFSIKTNKCPGHDDINFNFNALANFVNLNNICLTSSKRVYFKTT